jgi:hypothetical protein
MMIFVFVMIARPPILPALLLLQSPYSRSGGPVNLVDLLTSLRLLRLGFHGLVPIRMDCITDVTIMLFKIALPWREEYVL